jgi:ClpP class serine protease
MLRPRMDEARADELAELLTQGAWTHDYPITVEAAGALGLAVGTDLPRGFLQLMSLYPQPLRRTPSVESGKRPERRRPAPRPADD